MAISETIERGWSTTATVVKFRQFIRIFLNNKIMAKSKLSKSAKKFECICQSVKILIRRAVNLIVLASDFFDFSAQ